MLDPVVSSRVSFRYGSPPYTIVGVPITQRLVDVLNELGVQHCVSQQGVHVEGVRVANLIVLTDEVDFSALQAWIDQLP